MIVSGVIYYLRAVFTSYFVSMDGVMRLLRDVFSVFEHSKKLHFFTSHEPF